jgi:hypothetical protein
MAVDVSLIHIILWGVRLTCNPTCSVSTISFSMQSADVSYVNGLRLPAAESINRSPDNIFDLIKLAEGGFNRPFLITIRGGFQMVARVPHPATISKYFAVAS